jgi:hypothetical protein
VALVWLGLFVVSVCDLVVAAKEEAEHQSKKAAALKAKEAEVKALEDALAAKVAALKLKEDADCKAKVVPGMIAGCNSASLLRCVILLM